MADGSQSRKGGCGKGWKIFFLAFQVDIFGLSDHDPIFITGWLSLILYHKWYRNYDNDYGA